MKKDVPRILALTLGVSLMAPAYAAAQESIFDPENADFAQPEHDTSSGAGESIFDPENMDFEEYSGPAEGSGMGSVQTFTSASFRGDYASTLFVDTAFDGHEEDIVEWATRLGMRLDYDLSAQTRVVINAEFLHWLGGQQNLDQTNLLINAENVRTDFEARLGETYILHRPGRWSLRAGNLLTPWGSTDLVRPGDVINPTDMATAGLAGSDTLMPQPTLQASYSGEGWGLTALLVPFFVPNRTVLFGRDTALGGSRNPLVASQVPILGLLQRAIDPSMHSAAQPMLQSSRRPQHTPSNASGGLRATSTVQNTDLGLGVFYGWDRTPWIEMDEDLREMFALMAEDGQVLEDFDFLGFMGRNPRAFGISQRLGEKAGNGEDLFVSEYRRRTTLVLDVARYIGPIGVRADLAFSPQRTLYTTELEALGRAAAFGALGLSYERLDEEHPLAITAEGFWFRPFARDSAINQFFVSENERGPQDAELALIGDGLYGVAGALLWGLPWLDDTQLQVGGLYNISHRDWIASAAVSHRWYGWLRSTVGVNLFDGPDPGERLTLGGLYSNNDQVFVSFDGSF